MANKLFVMIGVLLLIKRDLFTFSSGAVALYLKMSIQKNFATIILIVFIP